MLKITPDRLRIPGILSSPGGMERAATSGLFWFVSPLVAGMIVLQAGRISWLLVVPSVLWLLFIGALLLSMLRHDRPWRVFQLLALSMASEHTVRIKGDTVRFGFRTFGLPFTLERVPLASIDCIHQSPGAASRHSGRDEGDWATSVWYTDASGEKALAWTGPPSSVQDAREQASALAALLGGHRDEPLEISPLPSGDRYSAARYP